MRKITKMAAISTGLVLAGAVAAAAVDAPPPAADAGLTTAEEQVGTEVPASNDSHPEAAADESGDITEESADAAEHGQTVSETAQATESGPGKGETVADVASDGRSGDAAAEHAQPEQATLGASNADGHRP